MARQKGLNQENVAFFGKMYILQWTGYGRMEPWGVSSLLSWYFPEKAARLIFFRPASPSTKGKNPRCFLAWNRRRFINSWSFGYQKHQGKDGQHQQPTRLSEASRESPSWGRLNVDTSLNWKVGKTWRSATNKPNWKMRSTGFYWPKSVTEWRWVRECTKGDSKRWFRGGWSYWVLGVFLRENYRTWLVWRGANNEINGKRWLSLIVKRLRGLSNVACNAIT